MLAIYYSYSYKFSMLKLQTKLKKSALGTEAIRRRRGGTVLPHMCILAHTCMGRLIHVWDIPYAYGTILCPIRVWASHMSTHA